MYGLQTTTPPVSEPVSVALLKQHLRLNINTEDNLIGTYITTARTMFEEWTQRQLCQATYTLYLDQLTNWYNVWGWTISNYNYPSSFPNTFWWQRPLLLPKSPVQSVSWVKYYDSNNVLQTMSTSNYVVDTTREPARILFQQYPNLYYNTLPRVQIQYVAGYTTVPTPIQHGIMLLAADLYQHREANTVDKLTAVPMGFKSLVDIYRVGDVTGGYDL